MIEQDEIGQELDKLSKYLIELGAPCWYSLKLDDFTMYMKFNLFPPPRGDDSLQLSAELGRYIHQRILNILSSYKQLNTNYGDLCKVTDNLYISNADWVSASKYEELRAAGIVNILSLYYSCISMYGFNIKSLDIEDIPNENIYPYFDTVYEFIDSGCTLVHCFAGISRSSAFVLAYLMRKCNINLETAYGILYSSRKCVCPNNGFLIQLIVYENELRLRMK
jgi:hypothetical protein